MELPQATCFCLPLGLSNQNVHACSSGCFLGASAGRSAWVSTDTISPSSTPPCSVLCPSSGLTSTSAILFSLLFSNFSQSAQKEFSFRKQTNPPKKKSSKKIDLLQEYSSATMTRRKKHKLRSLRERQRYRSRYRGCAMRTRSG